MLTDILLCWTFLGNISESFIIKNLLEKKSLREWQIRRKHKEPKKVNVVTISNGNNKTDEIV